MDQQIVADTPDLPDWAAGAVNLADPRLGAVAPWASDEFFAARERMLDPGQPVFVPGLYDENGKWMDGWETRRRRGPGHDACVVRLARPGLVRGVLVDTSFFTGNYPPACSVEACLSTDEDAQGAQWVTIVPPMALEGNSRHFVQAQVAGEWSHVRLSIYPDGGVARFRVYGEPRFPETDGEIDLAAMLNGAQALAWNDAHFGRAENLLLPGRGRDMGDGWETRRRREPGHDWCIIRLARPGVVSRVELDTAHFKGNYPDAASLQGALVLDPVASALPAQSLFWPELMGMRKLSADSVHVFTEDLATLGPVSHVRLNIHPDGGVSRLRIWGTPA